MASANANQESKSNLLVRCRALSATAGTHHYPCAVGQGRLGNEHVHAKVPNVRCVPFCLRRSKSDAFEPSHQDCGADFKASGRSSPNDVMSDPVLRWFRDPLDKAIKKLVSAESL